MIATEVLGAYTRLLTQMDKVVIGYAEIKRMSIAALLADQHVLLEGNPGTAKSLFVEVFQRAISNSLKARIQMTADVKPMDLVGVRIFNPLKGRFMIQRGPLCGKNFVLVDEINRAPGKTLSAVLSAMQERVVYISGREIELPDPYFVMATQNPIEQEGVFPLPEAAIDRFAAKLLVPYATAEEEKAILKNKALDMRNPQSVIEPVIGLEELVRIREGIKENVFVSDAAIDYIVALVRATRPECPEHGVIVKKDGEFEMMIDCGGSVRGQLAIRGLARVMAAIKGRSYVLPEDIREVAPACMRHRIAMSFEARAEGKTAEVAVKKILDKTDFKDKDAYYVPKAA